MSNQAACITLTFVLGALACGDRRPGASPASARDSADSAFALVQARGRQAMGVDQYTSTHRFEPLPDGGRITLTRDSADSAGEARIREHMKEIAASFRRGDFRLPGFVHDQEVPGTAAMRARRSEITYSAGSVPGGGQLRIQSRDSVAIAAIHEFLAFQRRDHRAGEHSHQ
jgi:hypothetical protein